ncbi:MAG: CDP-diacylglycerol--glycerol-3-phosphate 3-phosphatidyltransferase [Actinobacteria bacterium]|nr:MAG: CDP-diacylglycerol--glycerol-3-phosphate 3-phosphatidyltransferase [Actinomycetota bacterium]
MNAANRVTIARMVFIPVFLVVLLGEWISLVPEPAAWEAAKPWIAAVIFTVLAATDAVDGYLARSRNEVTTFGKFIDPLADKLLVTAALFALVDLDALPSWIAIVIVARELIVSGLRMVAVAEGKVIAASHFGKAKTVMQIVAITAFIVKDSALIGLDGAWLPVAVQWFSWAAMAAAVALTIWSMVAYFYHARDVLTGPWNAGRAS